MGLTSIFDHDQPVLLGQSNDRVHISHLSVQVHRNHCGHRTSTPTTDEAVRSVSSALFLEVFSQLLWIHSVCALVDVDEFGHCACLRNGFGSCDEGVRNGNNDITFTNACGYQPEAERVCSTVHRNRVLGIAESGEGILEVL